MMPKIHAWLSSLQLQGHTLEIGSRDINGKVRELFSSYVGLDAVPGPNVDVVSFSWRMPFPDASFDNVVCLEMLEHDARPQETIREIMRVLRPGGTLALSVPSISFLKHTADGHRLKPGEPGDDYWRFTMDGVRKLFEPYGIVNATEDETHVFTTVRRHTVYQLPQPASAPSGFRVIAVGYTRWKLEALVKALRHFDVEPTVIVYDGEGEFPGALKVPNDGWDTAMFAAGIRKAELELGSGGWYLCINDDCRWFGPRWLDSVREAARQNRPWAARGWAENTVFVRDPSRYPDRHAYPLPPVIGSPLMDSWEPPWIDHRDLVKDVGDGTERFVRTHCFGIGAEDFEHWYAVAQASDMPLPLPPGTFPPGRVMAGRFEHLSCTAVTEPWMIAAWPEETVVDRNRLINAEAYAVMKAGGYDNSIVSADEALRLTEDRDVVLVGNGAITDEAVGRMLDSRGKFVVRFNQGWPVPPVKQPVNGHFCDALGTTGTVTRTDDRLKEVVAPVSLYIIPDIFPYTDRYVHELGCHGLVWSEKPHGLDDIDAVVPSCGMAVMTMFTSRGRHVALVGFDWKKTPSWPYRNQAPDPVGHHNWEWEARKVEEYQRAGLVTLHKSRDIISVTPPNGDVDAVFLLGTGSKHDNLELQFALRSLERNAPWIRNVYVVGEDPGFLSSEVRYIRAHDIYQHCADANLIHKVTKACRASDLSQTFLVCSDDQLLLKPTYSLLDFRPMYTHEWNPDLEVQFHKSPWHRKLYRTLLRFGKTGRAFEPHVWSPVDKDRFMAMSKIYDWKRSTACTIFTLYYNHVQEAGTPVHDHAFVKDAVDLPDVTHLAYDDVAFSKPQFRELLLARFPERSKFERA